MMKVFTNKLKMILLDQNNSSQNNNKVEHAINHNNNFEIK